MPVSGEAQPRGASRISGEALTTRVLSTRQNLVEILQRLLANRDAARRQGVKKLGPTHPCELRSAALGDAALGIPEDRSRQAHLPDNLLGRSPQGGKNVEVELHLDTGH